MTTPAEYMRSYRQRRPEVAKRAQELNEARRRALERLATDYPRKFRRLYLEECRLAGIPEPAPVGRPKSNPISEGAGHDTDALEAR